MAVVGIGIFGLFPASGNKFHFEGLTGLLYYSPTNTLGETEARALTSKYVFSYSCLKASPFLILRCIHIYINIH